MHKASGGATRAARGHNERALRRWLAASGLFAMAASGLPVAPASAVLSQPMITTVAGTGPCVPLNTAAPADGCWSYGGDGGPATSDLTTIDPQEPNAGRALLNFPNSPVFDPAGNLYFADRTNHLVRRVVPGAALDVDTDGNGTLDRAVVDGDADEVITTVVGSLTTDPDIGPDPFPWPGDADGHRTTAAKLNVPTSLAVDLDGSGALQGLVIADQANHKVRYANLTASNTTVYGVSVPANGVKTIAGSGGCGTNGAPGPCTAAQYGSEGAGAMLAKINNPSGVALDTSGDLYIADLGNKTVRKVLRNSVNSDDLAGDIFTVAGTAVTAGFTGDGGAATSATLRGPVGVTFQNLKTSPTDPTNRPALFVTDQGNHNVRLVNLSASAPGVSVSANSVTVGAEKIHTVAGCSSECTSNSGGFSGDLGPAKGAAPVGPRLFYPFSTAFDSNTGALYISDENNNRVRVVDSSGKINTYTGVAPCVVNPVLSNASPCPDGTYNGDDIPAALAQLSHPRGLALQAGSLYIADAGNDRVRRVNPL